MKNKRVIRRPGLRSRVVDGEILVLDQPAEKIHQLNQTASFIWERCDGRHTAREIAKGITESFQVDSETAQKDVNAVLRQFESLGLVGVNEDFSTNGPAGENNV